MVHRLPGFRLLLAAACTMFWSPWLVLAQDADDQVLSTIRSNSSIPTIDQEKIARWVRGQFDAISAKATSERRPAIGPLREKFKQHYDHPENSQPFRQQLVQQTTVVGTQLLQDAKLAPEVAEAAAYVLRDFGKVETLPALLAMLKSTAPVARYMAARSLTELASAIATDRPQVEKIIGAVRDAALAESDPVVLTHLYRAIALPNQMELVIPALLPIFDKRATARRDTPVADGAEIEAYEYLRKPATTAALNPNLQADLVRRLAVFLRIDAQRYAVPELAPPPNAEALDHGFRERDHLERMLVANEEILRNITKKTGQADVAQELASGGYEHRAAVLAKVHEWIGDPEAGTKGLLNEAPWNVPPGAP